MPLRAAALPAAALSTTFLLTSEIDQRRSIISDPQKISTVPYSILLLLCLITSLLRPPKKKK
jgi:hypothetical protein